MSESSGSDGAFEDTVAAHDTKSWEARLKEARKQRAAVLAEANGHAPKRPVSDTPWEQTPPSPEETTLEKIVAEELRPGPEVEPVRKTPIRIGYAALVAALLCGAILHWVGTKAVSNWNAPEDVAETVQQASPETPPADDLPVPLAVVSASLSDPEAPDAVDVPSASARDTALLPEGAGVTPDSSPASESPTAVANPTSEKIEPAPEQILALADAETLPKPEPAYSRSAPTVSIPREFSAVPALYTQDARETPLPAPQITVSPAALSPDLNNSPSASDPFPGDSMKPPSPAFSEVKPLVPKEQIEALAVSLFVPARVSEDASNKALAVLTGEQTKVVATARVNFRVRQTQVRFYHPDDARNAELAAAALGGISRDFTGSGSKTRLGHIEVYLAGSGGAVQSKPPEKQTKFDRFLARLLNDDR